MYRLNNLVNHILWTGNKNIQIVWKYLLLFEQTVRNAPASERTHYHQLDDFNHPISDHIHTILEQLGFVNGNTEANKDNHKVQIFWWLYHEINSCTSRQPCLSADVSNHHASAAHRQQAILMSIDLVKNLIQQLYKINVKKEVQKKNKSTCSVATEA